MIPASAAIIGGGALLGSLGSGILGSSASKKAAGQSSQAQMFAAMLQYQMYQQTAARLQPWVDTGQVANKQLGGFLGLPGMTFDSGGQPGAFQTGAGVQPFQPTMDQLRQTPGYQFTLDEAQRAGRAAVLPLQGAGRSMVTGAESIASGLASQTYQQQFQNYWAQIGQVYNMLSGTSISGANAAAQVGQAGSSTAANAGNLIAGAGASQAAGTIGAASALQQPLNLASNLGGQLALLNATGQFGRGGGLASGTATPSEIWSGSTMDQQA